MSYDIDYTPDQRINRLAVLVGDLSARLSDLEDVILDDELDVELIDPDEDVQVSYEDVEEIVNRHCRSHSGTPAALSELRQLFGEA